MPIDYKKYPKNWKTEIRPNILQRAENKCEFCNVENHKIIIRGKWNGVECYQDENGYIYNAENSEYMGGDYLGEVHPTNKLIKVVLTVAHLDHDINNNDYSNLKALCQRCHNRHDIGFRKVNRKKNKGLLFLFD
jgi:ribosomal protein L37AE/L43A